MIVTFIIIWCFPVKCSITYNMYKKLKSQNMDKDVIICQYATVPFRYWKVVESDFELKGEDEYINILGNVPQRQLRKPVYVYSHVKYVLIGTFDEDSHSFKVEEWYPLGKIDRINELLPYPLWGLNIFEIKIFD